MIHAPHPDMAEVTRLTRPGRLAEATVLLRSLLAGDTRPTGAGKAPDVIDDGASAQESAAAAPYGARPSLTGGMPTHTSPSPTGAMPTHARPSTARPMPTHVRSSPTR